MKIELLKDITFSNKDWKKGQQLEVDREFGKRLVKKKIAKQAEFVTLTDLIQKQAVAGKVDDLFADLPTNIPQLLGRIKTLTDIDLLTTLLQHEKSTVVKAAGDRLDKLNEENETD